ncbi:MAG: sel1 repeat family protein [Deferribacteraceae bacterium]|jgi:TPR repeat protein|nr:sel1 repeat family protein [Deferribacteraceae bacterium]
MRIIYILPVCFILLIFYGCEQKPFRYDAQISSEITNTLFLAPPVVLKNAEEGDNLSTAAILAYSVINDMKIVINDRELTPAVSLSTLQEEAEKGEVSYIFCYGWALYFKDNTASNIWLEKAYDMGVANSLEFLFANNYKNNKMGEKSFTYLKNAVGTENFTFISSIVKQINSESDMEKVLPILDKASDKDNASALILGQIYSKGHNVLQNTSKARKYFDKLIKHGNNNGYALNLISYLQDFNYETAEKYALDALSQGVNLYGKLAESFFRRNSLAYWDADKALQYLAIADPATLDSPLDNITQYIEQNDIDIKAMIDVLTKIDAKNAGLFEEISADNKTAMFEYAKMADAYHNRYNDSSAGTAMKYFILSKDQEPCALAYIGEYYIRGVWAPAIPKTGFDFAMTSLKNGCIDANYPIGLYYASTNDIDNASKYLRAAAQAGNPFAAYELAEILVKQNPATNEVIELYTTAADNSKYYRLGLGFSKAMEKLGDCYFEGRGVKTNYKKANEWYAKANAAYSEYAKQMLEKTNWDNLYSEQKNIDMIPDNVYADKIKALFPAGINCSWNVERANIVTKYSISNDIYFNYNASLQQIVSAMLPQGISQIISETAQKKGKPMTDYSVPFINWFAMQTAGTGNPDKSKYVTVSLCYFSELMIKGDITSVSYFVDAFVDDLK